MTDPPAIQQYLAGTWGPTAAESIDRAAVVASAVSLELVRARVGGVPDTVARLFLEIGRGTIALSRRLDADPFMSALAASSTTGPRREDLLRRRALVPPDHPDSNFRMAREALLSKVAARVHPMDGAACAAGEYEKALGAYSDLEPGVRPGVPWAGRGRPHGSLFPGDARRETANVVRVRRPDHERLSLTLPVLSAARVAIFLVAGASKRAALAQLLGDGDVPAARVSVAANESE